MNAAHLYTIFFPSGGGIVRPVDPQHTENNVDDETEMKDYRKLDMAAAAWRMLTE